MEWGQKKRQNGKHKPNEEAKVKVEVMKGQREEWDSWVEKEWRRIEEEEEVEKRQKGEAELGGQQDTKKEKERGGWEE